MAAVPVTHFSLLCHCALSGPMEGFWSVPGDPVLDPATAAAVIGSVGAGGSTSRRRAGTVLSETSRPVGVWPAADSGAHP